MRSRLLVSLLALGLVTGCGTSDIPSATPAPTDPAATPTPVQTEFSCDDATGGSDDVAVFLKDVRLAAQPGADRLVFEFKKRNGELAMPHWEVRETEPPLLADASGEEVEVKGDRFLHVNIWATGVNLANEEPEIIYSAQEPITAKGTATVTEVVQAGDFENVLTFYVGLEGDGCFHVSDLESPLRLIVDVES